MYKKILSYFILNNKYLLNVIVYFLNKYYSLYLNSETCKGFGSINDTLNLQKKTEKKSIFLLASILEFKKYGLSFVISLTFDVSASLFIQV